MHGEVFVLSTDSQHAVAGASFVFFTLRFTLKIKIFIEMWLSVIYSDIIVNTVVID